MTREIVVRKNGVPVSAMSDGQALSLIDQVFGDADNIVREASSMLDDRHSSVTVSERIVIYVEEDY